MRRLLLAATAVSLPFLLGGWMVLDNTRPWSASAPPLGPVTVTTSICASQHPGSGCASEDGNSNFGAYTKENTPVQLLIAYLVEAGAGAPPKVESNRLGRRLVFARSPSYTAELQRRVPARAGFQWVGYISTPFQYLTSDEGLQYFWVNAPFALPRRADGQPFAGPFRYRSVAGARTAVPLGQTAGRPVSCGSSPFAMSDSNTTICIDDPSAERLATYYNQTLPTSDLGILAGPTVTVSAGGTARLRFVARYVGTATATLSLVATTGVKGADATPSLGSLTPGPFSSNPVTVEVPVPANTKGGTYPVTLIAARDQNTLRVSAGKVVVRKLLGRIRARVRAQWRVVGSRTKVLRLKVVGAPRGARISVKCGGRGCPYKGKRFKGSSVNLGKRFKRSLRAGAAIEIRITKSRYIGKFVRYKTRRGALPKAASRCLPPGAKKPRKKCR